MFLLSHCFGAVQYTYKCLLPLWVTLFFILLVFLLVLQAKSLWSLCNGNYTEDILFLNYKHII